MTAPNLLFAYTCNIVFNRKRQLKKKILCEIM